MHTLCLHIKHFTLIIFNVMDGGSNAHLVDFFALFINVISTKILFSSVMEVLRRPDFGALHTEPCVSNLSLMRQIALREGGGV